VVGYAASSCLVLACPWPDAEAHVREETKQCPLTLVRRFDPSLTAGGWCVSAYVCSQHGGEPVAVPLDWTPGNEKRRA
jgi:hypothetical protein